MTVGSGGFACRKCGEKGDLLRLIKLALGVEFPAAVAWLEKETGIPPYVSHPKRISQTKEAPPEIIHSGTSYEVLSAAPARTVALTADPAIYETFLSACCPVEGPVLTWLSTTNYISKEVADGMNLRFCEREYADIMDFLKASFKEDALLAAGLLRRSKSNPGQTVPAFWQYSLKKVGFLVIPYIRDGRPVYLKVCPAMGKENSDAIGLSGFMATAAEIPCLYNLDALKDKTKRILVFEGEFNTWTALTRGFAAVGHSGVKNFQAAWVDAFRGHRDKDGRSNVCLVTDSNKTAIDRSAIIADLFLTAGLPKPLRIMIPPGKKLMDFLDEEWAESWKK